jgi:hypothetical protein
MTAEARGYTAVMAQRREPPDAVDYFPTPLWASRALFRHVLPALGVKSVDRVWEPACGEGHMAAVITEFARKRVLASDIFDHDAWFVWRKTVSAQSRIFWIPPGCRAALTHSDDRRRFAAWTLSSTSVMRNLA